MSLCSFQFPAKIMHLNIQFFNISITSILNLASNNTITWIACGFVLLCLFFLEVVFPCMPAYLLTGHRDTRVGQRERARGGGSKRGRASESGGRTLEPACFQSEGCSADTGSQQLQGAYKPYFEVFVTVSSSVYKDDVCNLQCDVLCIRQFSVSKLNL